MNSPWIILAFLAPFFWACANYVDKFVISKYIKQESGVGSLVIFTGLTGFIMAIGIILLGHNVVLISISSILWIMLAGALLVASFIPYLYALQIEDSSVVVPLYQLIPLFTYVLALIFLKETLTAQQIIAGIFVIIGAILLSANPSNKYKLNIKVLGLMILAALAIAINSIMFKYLALENLNPWATGFWEYMGTGIFSICLWFFIKNYRVQFNSLVKNKNGFLIAGLNIGGEVLNLSAKLMMAFATLSAPIALVWIINGTQPFIILAMGWIMTIFIPHIIKEKITRKYLVQRVISMLVMFVGIYLLFK